MNRRMEIAVKKLHLFALLLSAAIVGSAHATSAEDVTAMAGLAAWYRADNVAKNADGALTELRDSSGKARTLVPGPKAPMVVDNVLNAKPVLRFSGTESPLLDEATNWSGGAFTVFIVASYDNIADKPALRDNPTYIIDTPGKALLSDGGSAGLALGLNWNGRPGIAAGISKADPQTAFDPPYANEQSSDLLVEARKFYAFSYASSEGKKNKTTNAWDSHLTVAVAANGTPSSVVTTPFISTQTMNGGKKLQIGAAGTRDAFKGDIAEIIVFNAELSTADKDRVSAYLRAKYQLEDAVKRLPAEPVAISPTLTGGTFWFRDAVTVQMSAPTAGSEIRYTTDGSTPSQNSSLYNAPLKLSASGTIKAQAFAAGRDASAVSEAKFVKIGAMKPTANKLAGGWKYSWGDEFNGPKIDESIWGYEIGYVRNSEAQYYSDRPENSRIDNGNLLIQGLHDNWEGHAYTSASRSTENKVTLTYGRYELRAKIDLRSGSWPAWWLWSRPDGAGWPKEGEIDMMEYYTGKTLFNVVDGNGQFDSKRKKISALGGPRWGDDFHVWTMDWDADKIDLYLDGALMSHYPVDTANGTGVNGANPYRNPQTKKIVLNQALGGSMGGALRAEDAPFELRVDWMRVHTWSNEAAYTLTVNGGTGSGPYVVGTKAFVTANMPPVGYTFDKWIVQGKATLSDPVNPTATVTMPKSDVTITATYAAK